MSSENEEIAIALHEVASQLKSVTDALQNLTNALSEGKSVTCVCKVDLEKQLRTELGGNI